MKFKDLFPNKPIIAMLHLLGDQNMSAFERAKKETDLYIEQGVDAVLVENYFGSLTDVAQVLAWLKNERADKVIYGVNVLAPMPNESFGLAKVNEAKFIQIDSVCGHLPPAVDQDFHEALMAMRQGYDGVVLGGVRFKYQPVRSARSLKEDLEIGMTRCDAIVCTGDATGEETPIYKLQEFREHIGQFPLIVGAGVAEDNIRASMNLADGAIVGSYFKVDHRAHGEVVPEFVHELTAINRDLRERKPAKPFAVDGYIYRNEEGRLYFSKKEPKKGYFIGDHGVCYDTLDVKDKHPFPVELPEAWMPDLHFDNSPQRFTLSLTPTNS